MKMMDRVGCCCKRLFLVDAFDSLSLQLVGPKHESVNADFRHALGENRLWHTLVLASRSLREVKDMASLQQP